MTKMSDSKCTLSALLKVWLLRLSLSPVNSGRIKWQAILSPGPASSPDCAHRTLAWLTQFCWETGDALGFNLRAL